MTAERTDWQGVEGTPGHYNRYPCKVTSADGKYEMLGIVYERKELAASDLRLEIPVATSVHDPFERMAQVNREKLGTTSMSPADFFAKFGLNEADNRTKAFWTSTSFNGRLSFPLSLIKTPDEQWAAFNRTDPTTDLAGKEKVDVFAGMVQERTGLVISPFTLTP